MATDRPGTGKRTATRQRACNAGSTAKPGDETPITANSRRKPYERRNAGPGSTTLPHERSQIKGQETGGMWGLMAVRQRPPRAAEGNKPHNHVNVTATTAANARTFLLDMESHSDCEKRESSRHQTRVARNGAEMGQTGQREADAVTRRRTQGRRASRCDGNRPPAAAGKQTTARHAPTSGSVYSTVFRDFLGWPIGEFSAVSWPVQPDTTRIISCV